MSINVILPPELLGVSPTRYLAAIIIELISCGIIVFLVIQAIKKSIERKKAAAYLLSGLYIVILVGLFLTAFAKVLVYFSGWDFSSAQVFDKFGLFFVVISNIFLFAFDLEIFTKFTNQKKALLIGGYSIIAIIPMVYELINLYQTISFIGSIGNLIATLIVYIYHSFQSRKMRKKAETPIEKVGITYIFNQGIFQALAIAAAMLSPILIDLKMLPRFNFLYFFRFFCIILALGYSYLGYFLPEWIRRKYQSN
jgi:hypothetical protein